MPELAFDEIVLPEQEEDSADPVESVKFDEIVLPRDSGQFEQIVLPQKPKTEAEAALAETPDIADHSNAWNQRRRETAKQAEAAGILPTLDSRQRLIDAIARTESAGFKTPHFIGLPDEPTGDRGVTRDIENLVVSLKAQEAAATGPERELIAKQRAYWEQEAAEGMSKELWRTQTGEDDPKYPHEKELSFLPQSAAQADSADAKVATFSNLKKAHELASQPLWNPELYQPKKGDTVGTRAEKALYNSGAQILSSFTSPEMMALLPLTVIRSAGRAVAGIFSGQMLGSIPDAWNRVQGAEKTPAWSQERMEAGLNMLTLGVFTKAALGHFVNGRAPVRPASEPEASAATTERVAEQTVQPDSAARRLVPIEEIPKGEPDAIPIRSAESEIPRTSKTGQDQPGINRETRPREPIDPAEANAAAVSTAPETIGTEAAIAEIQRRNAPNTEPVIPKEPAGTKFPEPQEIMSPGPGAASAKETLASYELRRFGERFQKTEGIAPEIREETGNRYYEPIPNKLTLDEAGKIIEVRGTDEAVRLVRDETFAMEPRVRATLAQTLVQKLNQSHAEATAAGDAVRAKGFLDQAVDTAEYLGEFGTRLGQGVQSFAIWSRLTPEGMLESAKRSAKRAGVELTPEQMAEIRRLAAEAHAAKEGIPKHDATKKLADYMVQRTGIPARDLPLSIYYTHILSGVQTHIVNAVDTGLNVLHEVNNLAVTNPRAAASIYAGLMRGLGEGKYDGLLSLQEGRRIVEGKFIESPDLLEVSKFGEKGGVPIAVTGKVSAAAKRISESKIAKPLNAYKYVMRMMSASDAVFFRGAEEARAGLLAHRLAEATGAERAKLKSEADSILGYDRLPEFRAEAAKEGYTGAKAEARATELMIQSRPESLRADASDYAGVSTYNHAPRGVLGYLSNQVAQVSNKYPALKLFVPFTRIVANVTNRGLDNTPMGIMRALREKGISKEERQRVLTRGIAGTAGIIGLGVLNATGVIQIHGAGPSDIEKKRQLQNAGWKPFSLQVGDKYFTYTYTPIGLGVSVLGNYLDSQRYNELSQKDSLTRVAYSMSRIGQTVFSQSFLSGLSNLFTILSGDPGRSVSSLKQFFSNVATAATTPNLARDINHLFDPTARKSESVAQDLIRNIPVARLSLKPTLNAFGEPVELSRNRFFSGKSDDPAWRLVVKQNLRVPVVDQTTFEDSDVGYSYAKIAGTHMRRYIIDNFAALNSATPREAQEMLSKAAKTMFEDVRVELVESGGVKKKKKR